jgi:hypothetical protein
MCNLSSLTKGQAAIRDWFRARNDRTGNLPLFPGIFPDKIATKYRAHRQPIAGRFPWVVVPIAQNDGGGQSKFYCIL